MADVREVEAVAVTADVVVVTNVETAVVTAGPLVVPDGVTRAVILARTMLLVGTTTNAVYFRIRRGATAAGTAVDDGDFENDAITAAKVRGFTKWAVDAIANVASVTYTATLQQNAGAADGTAQSSQLLILLI